MELLMLMQGVVLALEEGHDAYFTHLVLQADIGKQKISQYQEGNKEK
jgi:hypothetical protein